MEECKRCKELEKIIFSLQSRIEDLERLLGLNTRDDDDDDPGGFSSPGYLDKVKAKKPGKQYGKKKKKKSRGAKKGHVGHGRQKCETIDREVDLTLDLCPDCGGALNENKQPEEWVQEDLEIKKIATLFKLHRYECPCCKKNVKPSFETGFIGSTAKTLSALLHYYSGVTFNKIKEIYGWFGLNLSEGSLSLWGGKYAKKFENSYEDLKESLKKSAYVNVDETGWPIDGDNKWLWVFRSPNAVVYRIEATRGSSVVKDTLGEEFDGILASDFYSAYNPLDYRNRNVLSI